MLWYEIDCIELNSSKRWKSIRQIIDFCLQSVCRLWKTFTKELMYVFYNWQFSNYLQFNFFTFHTFDKLIASSHQSVLFDIIDCQSDINKSAVCNLHQKIRVLHFVCRCEFVSTSSIWRISSCSSTFSSYFIYHCTNITILCLYCLCCLSKLIAKDFQIIVYAIDNESLSASHLQKTFDAENSFIIIIASQLQKILTTRSFCCRKDIRKHSDVVNYQFVLYYL